MTRVKIEEGKFYRTREGEKVGPMRSKISDWWGADGDGRAWSVNGVRCDESATHPTSITSEWTEAPKFKVGDRVRFTDQTPEYWWVKPGMEGVISGEATRGGVDVMVHPRGSVWGVREVCLKLIHAAPAFTLDWPHGHVTRDGRKARVVCTDLKGDETLVVAIADEDGTEKILTAFANGRQFASTVANADLLNAPAPKREWWVNVYRDAAPDRWDSRDDADELSRPNRLACVHVTEGDGL